MENDTQSKPNIGRSILWLVVLALLVAGGFAWSRQRPSETIKIGVIAPLTGGLAQVRELDGVSGKLVWDEKGNITRAVYLKEIRNGQFVPYEK